MEDSNVKIAINGGIGFGSKLNAKQLAVITKYMHENDELELTTFQQLYIGNIYHAITGSSPQ